MAISGLNGHRLEETAGLTSGFQITDITDCGYAIVNSTSSSVELAPVMKAPETKESTKVFVKPSFTSALRASTRKNANILKRLAEL